MNTVSAKIMLMNGDLDEKLAYLYACPIEEAVLHRERLINAIEKFEELFGVSREISIFSAPGRTEIGGNRQLKTFRQASALSNLKPEK